MKVQIIILFVLLWSVCGTVYAQPVQEHGMLRVQEGNLLDENDEKVVLKGMSFAWHNWWSRFYNESAVKWLAEEWNCSVVRIAMGVEEENGYLDNPEWSLEVITPVIEAAIENGIYVIIDWHCHNIFLDEAKLFFSEIAMKYGNNPNVIYEIFNEPDDELWSEIKNYAKDLIETIRKIDPDNIILVGTPDWSQGVDFVAYDPIAGYENIMYTLHFYAGTHSQFLRDKAESAIQKGLPIFISECSAVCDNGDGKIDFKEFKEWSRFIQKNDLSWLFWAVSDKKETTAILNPGANSYGGWDDSELSDTGKFDYKELNRLNIHNNLTIGLCIISLILVFMLTRKFQKRFMRSARIARFLYF